MEVHVFQCRCPMSQLIKFRGNLKSIQHNLHLLRYQNHLDHDGEVVLIEEGKKMSCEMASERSSMKLAHQIRKRLPREKIFCTKSHTLLGGCCRLHCIIKMAIFCRKKISFLEMLQKESFGSEQLPAGQGASRSAGQTFGFDFLM